MLDKFSKFTGKCELCAWCCYLWYVELFLWKGFPILSKRNDVVVFDAIIYQQTRNNFVLPFFVLSKLQNGRFFYLHNLIVYNVMHGKGIICWSYFLCAQCLEIISLLSNARTHVLWAIVSWLAKCACANIRCERTIIDSKI